MTEKPTNPPVIAVSGKVSVAENNAVLEPSASVKAACTQMRQQGAELVIIDHRSGFDAESLDAYDALIIMGNDNDIDPAHYNEAPEANTKIETDRAHYASDTEWELAVKRAEWETKAIQHASALQIPLLGICGGMQRMNIAAGGLLNQHVEGLWQSEPCNVATETLLVNDNSVLADPNHAGPIGINSFQHQAIEAEHLALGFKSIGVSPADPSRNIPQTIQAIASVVPGKFALGVQWHPEFMPESALSQHVFSSLADAARTHQQSRIQSAAQGRPNFIKDALAPKPEQGPQTLAR